MRNLKSRLVYSILSLGICLLLVNNARAEDEAPAKDSFIKINSDKVQMSGLLEVDATAGKDFDKKNVSDVTLSTAQLGFDAEVQKWATGHLLFLYEEDGTDGVDVDEATITLGGTEEIPTFLTVGKMYVPFGVYDSSNLSDPMTLELGETNQSAIQVGLKSNGFYGSVYGFNCDVDEASEDSPDQVKCFGANAGYAHEAEEGPTFAVEVGYTSNLVDSDGYEAYLEDSELSIKDHVGGYFISANAGVDNVKLIGEVVAGTDDVKFADDTNAGTPVTYALEANYGFKVMEKDALFALGYQASDKLGGVLPESRILATVNVALSDEIATALEYSYNDDYSEDKGGSGSDANAVTLQLSHGF